MTDQRDPSRPEDEFESLHQVTRNGQTFTGTKADLENRLAVLDADDALKAEQREMARQHEVDRLMRQLAECERRYVHEWDLYSDLRECDHGRALRHLDKATESLAAATTTLQKILKRPRADLVKNENVRRFVAHLRELEADEGYRRFRAALVDGNT